MQLHIFKTSLFCVAFWNVEIKLTFWKNFSKFLSGSQLDLEIRTAKCLHHFFCYYDLFRTRKKQWEHILNILWCAVTHGHRQRGQRWLDHLQHVAAAKKKTSGPTVSRNRGVQAPAEWVQNRPGTWPPAVCRWKGQRCWGSSSQRAAEVRIQQISEAVLGDAMSF